MNKTKIDWCDMSWNPVTGCLHGCPYCYARQIVKRFGAPCNSGEIHRASDAISDIPYPFGFEPTIYENRLVEPQRTKKPQNIFVCSMADLFGDWIPDEWIEKVFKACEAAPQHRYLFLTKNPIRYEQYINRPMPKNMWFGFSQIEGKYIGFDTHPNWNTFISMEPLLRDLGEGDPQGIDWVIIGAETGNRKNRVIPKHRWIENIVKSCQRNYIPVFMKNSLADIWGEPLIQQYPWDKGVA
jgi:protein gp37